MNQFRHTQKDGHSRDLKFQREIGYKGRAQFCSEMAEGVGFEPTDGCPSPVFKTGAIDHSATLPAFRADTPDSRRLRIAAMRTTRPSFLLSGGSGQAYAEPSGDILDKLPGYPA